MGLKHWWLVGLFLILSAKLTAQNYTFLSYSNDKGLPQSQVQAMAQDPNGYLWVGTLGGLAKFNGKVFLPISNDKQLLNNRITKLFFDKNDLLVGHQGGLSRIRNGKVQVWHFRSIDALLPVTDIVAFQNAIYVGVEGGGIYVLQNNQLVHHALPNENANLVRALLVAKNTLYVGTKDGLYSSVNGDVFKYNSTANVSISDLVLQNNKIVLLTYNDGVFKTDLKVSHLQQLEEANNRYIISGMVDANNRLWLCSDLGVECMQTTSQRKFYTTENGLLINQNNCVFQDKSGTIWLGSDGKGLLRFCGEEWAFYNSKNNKLVSDLIVSGKKLPSGEYLFGSYGKGAFSMKLDGKSKSIDVPASVIWGIESDENWCYFATDEGLYARALLGGKAKLISPKNDLFRCIKKIDNVIYAAGEMELGIIKNGVFVPFQIDSKSYRRLGIVQNVASYNNQLYIAASNGLFKLQNNQHLEQITQFKEAAFTLAVDQRERLWIGTENGLFIFNGITVESFSLGKSSGGKFINFLNNIDEHLFVGTNNGMYVIDLEEKPVLLKQFGLNSGLINLESNLNSCFYDGNYLWFGTAEGLARFQFTTDRINQAYSFDPKIIVTDWSLNYQSQTHPELLFSSKKQLSFSYNKNNLSFEFDAVYLSDPENVLFQFWVEGLDPQWRVPTVNSNLVLSNLPDGDYTIHVRCLNALGAPTDEMNLSLVIRAPFWRTWWFILIALVVIFFSIRYFLLVRLKREREANYRENLENKARLLTLEQQSLNASMNRHFIFNSLNSIQYFINTQDKLSANRFLTNFAKLIRKNLDSAAENENMVSLQQELERLELYLSLESMRFKDRFTYEIDEGDVEVEQIEVPSMLLQPFVENSIIHGILPDETKVGKINVTLKQIGSQLEICIDDNGIGIEFSKTKKAGFAGDHRSRGMEITSKRIELIRSMTKKDFDIIGPFQMENSDHSIKGTRVLIKIPLENLDY